MTIIEIQDLWKSFRVRGKGVEAVRGIDLRVEEGEIFGFLGPNGAGKTTTLRVLATLLPPDKGRAIVAGHDLLREPARVRASIGYVGQAGGADGMASGRENLVLQARLYGMTKDAATKRAAELIADLEMAPFADRLARTYSGGQRRRLDLALGIAHRPALLFLDEPSIGLDPQSRAHLWEEVRKLHASGTTIFLTTHYLEEADSLCDRLAIIDDGKIVAEGTPTQLKQQIAGDVI
ncbi:MAG: ATP-binding cassette domain-containing protein, partial [Ktedonobacteraceae bacterium]